MSVAPDGFDVTFDHLNHTIHFDPDGGSYTVPFEKEDTESLVGTFTAEFLIKTTQTITVSLGSRTKNECTPYVATPVSIKVSPSIQFHPLGAECSIIESRGEAYELSLTAEVTEDYIAGGGSLTQKQRIWNCGCFEVVCENKATVIVVPTIRNAAAVVIVAAVVVAGVAYAALNGEDGVVVPGGAS